VIDTHYLEQIQRLFNVLGRPLFTRMGHAGQPGLPGHGKHALELVRRVAPLGTVQPDGDEMLAQRQRLFQRGDGIVLTEVAQEAEDQPRADTQLPLALGQRP
jgi:hypothetical protein